MIKTKTIIGILIWIAAAALICNLIFSHDNAVRRIELNGINSPVVTLRYDTHLNPTYIYVGTFFSQSYDRVQVGVDKDRFVTYQGLRNDSWYQAQEARTVITGITQRISKISLENKTLIINCDKDVGIAIQDIIMLFAVFGTIGGLVIFLKFGND